MDPPHEIDATDELPRVEAAVLAAACSQPLPVWAQQIDTARLQMQAAVASLTRRFEHIASRLDAALDAARSQADADTVAQDTAAGQHLLARVIETLRAIRASRDAQAREICGLAAYSNELRKMSNDIESIAFKTNVLAHNAAIEATHAGNVGRGFAAVAEEVRQLSAAARDTGKSVSRTVGLIDSALARIVITNEHVSIHEQTAVTESEQQVRTVLERFRQRTQLLIELAARFSSESESVKAEVGEALAQLQFQDRTKRILQQVVASMAAAQPFGADTGTQGDEQRNGESLDA